jgi:hypothetical protein
MYHYNVLLAHATDWAFWWLPRPTYQDYWEAMWTHHWKDNIIPNIPGC